MTTAPERTRQAADGATRRTSRVHRPGDVSALLCTIVTSETPTAVDSMVRDYVEYFRAEDDVLAAARHRADDAGCRPVGPGSGAALSFLAAAGQAKAVVEVGTGTGVSGLCLLRGMAADGVLTSIDIDPERQRAARSTFTDAGVPAARTRLIMGHGLEVLPRLTAAGYDLVFVDAPRTDYPRYFAEGVCLLRPGGVIVFNEVLNGGRVADPADSGADTAALRELHRVVREDERVAPVLLLLSDGLLAAAKL